MKFPVLRKGDKNGYVLSLEIMLQLYGYYTDKLDADFGKNLEKALKEFQYDNLLKVDGICGEQVWGRLTCQV